ncbi:methyl-accepting chemotaxis protein, partial [Desulfovibrio aminophilus]
MFRKGISLVLIGPAALAVIVAVSAIVVYVWRSSNQLALDLERQAMLQTAQTAQKALAAYNENALGLVRILARQRAVTEAFGGDGSRLDAYLQLYVSANKNIWAVLVFDAKGEVLSGYNARGESLAGQSRADRAYVKAVLSGRDIYLGNEILAARSDSDVLISNVAAAVKDESGKVVGGVGVFPRWDTYTASFIDPPRFGMRGYGFMLDSQGRFIANAQNKGAIFQSVGKEDFVKKALAQEVGQIEYLWKGEGKIMAFTTDPETGWLIGMSAYTDELITTANTQRNILLGVGGLAVLVLVAVIAFIVRRLVARPIQEIEAFTKAVAAGDLKVELRQGFRYELKGLAENIRVMVAELKNKLGFSQGVLRGFTTPCVIYDTDNRVTFTNAQMMDALDKDGAPEAQLGKTSGDFVYGQPDRVTSSLRTMRENRSIRHEVPYTSAKGATKMFDISTTPIHDMDGAVIGTLSVWFELTEIRAQQKRIAEQNERIAKAAAAANQVSDQVASASEELSAQIEQSSRGSEVQRERTGEAAAAIEEMNATVMEVAKNASTAAELADQAKNQAQDGEKLVREVVAAISRINEQSEVLKADMTELGKQAEGIGQIMNVIADIADQTNLLALNAAIEAARAG